MNSNQLGNVNGQRDITEHVSECNHGFGGTTRSIVNSLGNFSGAFADGAILFPLIWLISSELGYSYRMLLLTAGLAYVVAGCVFRIPIPVQPLKSLAVSALALHATSEEVRITGALIGLSCLILLVFDPNRLTKKIPIELVHGIQLSLGLLLLMQGVRNQTHWYILLALILLLVGFSEIFSFPLLGWVASLGFIYSILDHSQVAPPAQWHEGLKASMVVGLFLPQLVLTLTNSVVGTFHTSEAYFGKTRVTPKGLLTSIGIGNILSAFVGGLPFCHGAGGLTAHVKGGAKHFSSNLIIGVTLIGLSVVVIHPTYPPWLSALLLGAMGIFHMKLSLPSWKTKPLVLVTMALATMMTKNLLWSLLSGALLLLLLAILVERGKIRGKFYDFLFGSPRNY